LQVHQLDVFPHRHDCFLAGRLVHVDDLGKVGAELVALGVLVAVEVDGDVHVLVAVPLEGELIEVGHGWQVARPRRCPVRLLPFDAAFPALAPRLLAVKVDRQGLEKVRQPRPLGRRRLGLGLAGRVRFHLVAVGLVVAGLALLLVRLHFIFVIEQAALDLNAVGRFEVGRKVKGVDVEAAVVLPELVLHRVADPDAQRLVPLCHKCQPLPFKINNF
jgi:hypothetical protein